MSCSKVHLRLVKKLPGQPPAGAIVPWAAAGAAPNVMRQAPPLAAESFHLPATSTGGGAGGGGGGGDGDGVAAATGWAWWGPVLVQAASAAATTHAAAVLAAQ